MTSDPGGASISVSSRRSTRSRTANDGLNNHTVESIVRIWHSGAGFNLVTIAADVSRPFRPKRCGASRVQYDEPLEHQDAIKRHWWSVVSLLGTPDW